MEYRKKQRPLKIRMLDGTVKTIMVDDSKTVTDMLMTICARIGKGLRAQEGGSNSGKRRCLLPLPLSFLQASPTMMNILWFESSWKRKRRK